MIKKDSIRKSAFTLAEALITIMIIGVLMALMLRAINRVNPDKDKILFVKSYHATEAVIADIISDPTKYDQAYISDSERTERRNSGETLHSDFRDSPYESAKVTYVNAAGNSVAKDRLSQSEAICYFMADQINSIGGVDCAAGDRVNFRSTTNVCFKKWVGVDSNGSVDGVVDPSCSGSNNSSYVIRVFADGKMTVPQTVSGYANQSKAYNWINTQTDLK